MTYSEVHHYTLSIAEISKKYILATSITLSK